MFRQVGTRLEAIASRLEAIATRVEAIATRVALDGTSNAVPRGSSLFVLDRHAQRCLTTLAEKGARQNGNVDGQASLSDSVPQAGIQTSPPISDLMSKQNEFSQTQVRRHAPLHDVFPIGLGSRLHLQRCQSSVQSMVRRRIRQTEMISRRDMD